MGLAQKIVKSTLKRIYTRLMDRVGGKVVSNIADTSSDAPNAFYVPKRDLYAKLSEEEGGRPAEFSDR